MLPLPNLDDRTFEHLVREARDLIPGIFPEWTDENAHDPGITLMELLAWLIEMQQFQLDRLNVRHERKFLKLLGEAPRGRTPAATSVSFAKAPKAVLIPYGTLLKVGELPFETVRPITVLPDTKRRVFVHTTEETSEISDDFESGSAPFYPFGEQSEIGSRMEITFSTPLPEAMPLSLWIELDSHLVPPHRIPARYQDFVPSGRVEWHYWDERTFSWQPVELERDESYGFHQSGPVLFEIPKDAGPVLRISALLADGSYQDPPYIRRLIWNEVFARQGETHCISEYFDGIGAEAAPEKIEELPEPSGKPYSLRHALFHKGIVQVQFRLADGGWIDVDENRFEVVRTSDEAWIKFHEGTELPTGRRSIRAIALSPEFVGLERCGTGTGLSDQSCSLPILPLFADQIALQVGWQTEDSERIVWYDWERVLDFDASDSVSYHYVIDEEEGIIQFSDGVRGAVPPFMPYPNIRIVGYRTGVGEEGNVKENTIRQMDFTYPLQVTNLYPAYGGSEPETTKEAMERTRKWVLQPNCGITAEDLENRVMEIPGLRIARVKVIPGYKTSIHQYPEERAHSHISIVIVPKSKQPRPSPTEGIIETVRKHLEPYRLLTTKFHIIPPEYVKVTVRAVIVVDPRYEGRESDVVRALTEWMQPYGHERSDGWEFGRTVYKSDVYDVIHRVSGIHYIQDLWLMADGRNVRLEEGGDIRIPPHGLVVSGEHEIEFVTSNR